MILYQNGYFFKKKEANSHYKLSNIRFISLGILNAKEGSCVFLFTDADPKDFNLCEEIGHLIQQKNIHLVTFLTGQCNGQLKSGQSSDCIHSTQQPFSCSRKSCFKIIT